jgi:hypothetical protein
MRRVDINETTQDLFFSCLNPIAPESPDESVIRRQRYETCRDQVLGPGTVPWNWRKRRGVDTATSLLIDVDFLPAAALGSKMPDIPVEGTQVSRVVLVASRVL